MTLFLEILPDLDELIKLSLTLILERIENALVRQGLPYFSIALAGGNTPKPLYEALAKENLPWDKIQVFWGDERYVPNEHPDSNQRMARLSWLDLVEIPSANIHPIPTNSNSPSEDAQKYEQELKAFFQVNLPSFDLILLGMGDDGHTASLFPYTSALNENDKLVTVGNKGSDPRITLTYPIINESKCVMFLVTGKNKQTALSHIFADEAEEQKYPSRGIKPKGELWWLLDESAGRYLKK